MHAKPALLCLVLCAPFCFVELLRVEPAAALPELPVPPPAHLLLPEGPMPEVAVETWEGILGELRVDFFDPETSRRFTVVGPFEILARGPGRLEVRGAAAPGQPAPRVTLTADAAGVWVVALFEDREFATRLR